jgi:LEA14-like dessication related protein
MHACLQRLNVIILIAAPLLLGGCGEVGGLFARPEADIQKVSMGEVSTRATQLVFDVDITNPYNADLPLSNLDYALSTEGTRFLSGQADLQGSIPAATTKTIQLPVDVPYVELYDAVEGAWGKAEIPYLAELGLSVDAPVVGRLRLPTSTEGTLKLPTRDSALDYLREEIRRRAGQ